MAVINHTECKISIFNFKSIKNVECCRLPIVQCNILKIQEQEGIAINVVTGDRALCVWAWVGVGNLGDKLRSGLALGTHETQAQPPPPAISTSCRRAAKVITSFRHQQQADFEEDHGLG